MNNIVIGGASINQTALDWPGNRRRIIEAIKIAKENEVKILCLPELCITGYGCEDVFYKPYVQQKTIETLLSIATYTEDIIVCLGLSITYLKKLFNVAAVINDKELIGLVAKQFLAGKESYYEPRWFTPWPTNYESYIEIGNNKIPLGDIYFNFQ